MVSLCLSLFGAPRIVRGEGAVACAVPPCPSRRIVISFLGTVAAVAYQTGFGQGLYSDDELDSSLVKAKPAKIAYLDKLIMLIGTSLNTLVDARPNKIVAGLEADNTNRMLQLLALAAVENPDSSRCEVFPFLRRLRRFCTVLA